MEMDMWLHVKSPRGMITSKILRVENITQRYRKVRMRWVEHLKSRDHVYVGRKTLWVVATRRIRSGIPKQRWTGRANREYES